MPRSQRVPMKRRREQSAYPRSTARLGHRAASPRMRAPACGKFGRLGVCLRRPRIARDPRCARGRQTDMTSRRTDAGFAILTNRSERSD
ncbi:hypothetical protein BURMUCF1_1772 [Burkholderia multivorans ATCC BAA-247]|nr:hypothetical protein BURMUCF1_1772 [Burkholderia multivorans ATCC BAA-247]